MPFSFSPKLKEYIELFFLRLKVSFINLIEYIRVVTHYYSRYSFLKIDGYLIFSYLFHNPFNMSKRFLLQKGETDIYTYGETPLTTLELIAKECRITKDDKVFELGCGRGRTCFWLNQFIGCEVVGIDYVPEFIRRANVVKEKFHLNRVEFRLEDFAQSDLSGATVIYLYGTCYSPSFIQHLASHFESLPKGSKLITVSYPLKEYAGDSSYKVMNRFPARFTWGEADVYLQIKA